jgi:hypothetical protein
VLLGPLRSALPPLMLAPAPAVRAHYGPEPMPSFDGLFRADAFASFAKLLIYAAAAAR